MKLSNAHLAVTSFAALAGVAIAAYQTFAPAAPNTPIMVALPPIAETAALAIPKDAPAPNEPAKTDGLPRLAAIKLGGTAEFGAALQDGTDRKYRFATLFDGDPATGLTIAAPDREINVLVDFSAAGPQTIAALAYTPPAVAGSGRATTIDVMVLPSGRLEASGRAVMSFTLEDLPGPRTFVLPNPESGKGLWLRVAGPPDGDIAVGEIAVLRSD